MRCYSTCKLRSCPIIVSFIYMYTYIHIHMRMNMHSTQCACSLVQRFEYKEYYPWLRWLSMPQFPTRQLSEAQIFTNMCRSFAPQKRNPKILRPGDYVGQLAIYSSSPLERETELYA